MVLDGVRRQIETAKALDRIIVEANMGQLHAAVGRGPRGRFRAGSGNLSSPHCKVVVLGRDLHLTSLQVKHRMVRPVVPELQLIRLQSQRESDDLMAEADPEDGPLAEQRPYRLDRVGNSLRVARTVGQEYPVGIQRQRGVGRGRGRDDRDLEALIH